MLWKSVSVILRDRDDEEERGGDGQIAEVRHATEQLRRGETSRCDGRQQEPLDRCRNVPSEVASEILLREGGVQPGKGDGQVLGATLTQDGGRYAELRRRQEEVGDVAEKVVSSRSRLVVDGTQVIQRDVVAILRRLPRGERSSSKRPVLRVAGDVDAASRVLRKAVEGSDSDKPGTDLRERKPFVAEYDRPALFQNHHEGVPRRHIEIGDIVPYNGQLVLLDSVADRPVHGVVEWILVRHGTDESVLDPSHTVQ